MSSAVKRAAIDEAEIVEAAEAAAAAVLEESTVTPPPAKKRVVEASASSRDVGTKPYKGLRHFSMMVCKKVEEKGTTTYNEVADELVNQVLEDRRREDPNGKYDEKNIRRRVYDALNVLMAMDIITKDKKAITWKGLPTAAHQDISMLEREREFRQAEVLRKREALRELLVQQVCFRNLVAHNQARVVDDKNDHKIPLPFIVVNTSSSAVIQCTMSRGLTDVMIDFSMPFEINDDNTILKRLGMHNTDLQSLREWVPDENILSYLEDQGMLESLLGSTTTPATCASSDFYGSVV